jgi:hypothetical protein
MALAVTALAEDSTTSPKTFALNSAAVIPSGPCPKFASLISGSGSVTVFPPITLAVTFNFAPVIRNSSTCNGLLLPGCSGSVLPVAATD